MSQRLMCNRYIETDSDIEYQDRCYECVSRESRNNIMKKEISERLRYIRYEVDKLYGSEDLKTMLEFKEKVGVILGALTESLEKLRRIEEWLKMRTEEELNKIPC